VLFAKRVPPEKVPSLLAVLAGDVTPQKPVVQVASQVNDARVPDLLEDVDRLTKEVVDLKDRLERCARATDDQKAIYWKNRALLAEGSQKKSDYDQT
jgi:hypothetical protein